MTTGARATVTLAFAFALLLAGGLAAQDCTPDQTLMGTPVTVYSCQGMQEVEYNGVDQVFDHSAGMVLSLDGNSYGFTAGATGGSTGTVGDWTFVSSTAIPGGYLDQLFFVPMGAGPGEQIDIEQRVLYTNGDEFFTIEWTVTNNTLSTFTDVRLLHGTDSYVNGDDAGDAGEEYFVTPPISYSVGLRDILPVDLFQGVSGILMASDPEVSQINYFTSGYSAVWTQIRTQGLPDTVDPTEADQGMAIAFHKNNPLTPGSTWSVSLLWVFDFPSVIFDPDIATQCLPCAKAGAAYNETLVAVNGLTPYTWSVVAPTTLPPGLALDPMTGNLSGTLSVAGTYNFRVRVEDSSMPTKFDEQDLTLDGNCSTTCAVNLCGDCDGNGRVDILDPLAAARFSAGLYNFLSGTEFANCNVWGTKAPDPTADVTIMDALTIAQSRVGLTTLDCCPGLKLEQTLTCGEDFCGRFDVAGTPGDLTDYATTNYLSIPVPPPGRGFRFDLTGSGGNADLYVGAPGTSLGDENVGNYAFVSSNPTTSETIFLDETTMPFAITDYMGGEIAIAVKGVMPGSYTLTVDCTCAPIDISATGTYVGDTSLGIDETDGSCQGTGGPEIIVRYDLMTSADLVISTDNPGTLVDTTLYVTQNRCNPPLTETACDDDGGTGTTSTISINSAAPGTYYIFIDSAGAGGAVELTVTEVVPMGCPATEGTIAGAGPFPVVVMGNTVGAADDSTPVCSGGGADHIYDFTPTATGTYRVSLCGSSYDTLLDVRADHCSVGASVGCDDDATGICSPDSQVDVMLTAGTTYYIVVDGFTGSTGDYVLTVDALDICSATVDNDLGMMVAPFTVMGDTTAADDSFVATCGGVAGPDHLLRYSPPADVVVDIDTCGSTFDTFLEVLDSDCLVGMSLGCNDDGAGCGPQSQIDGIVLRAGTVYYFRVSGAGGASGSYTLNVTPATGCSGSVESVIPGAGPFPHLIVDDSTAADDTTLPTCGVTTGEDHVHEFTPAATGSYLISTCGSAFDTILQVRQDECILGANVGCSDNTGSCSPQSELTLTLNAGTTYFIAVDSATGVGGSYMLTVDAVNVCGPTVDVNLTGMGLPIAVMGDTSAADDSFLAGCGAAAAGPDHIYEFTPAVTEMVDIDTCGSTLDTILEVFQGDCIGGSSLGCNDDGPGCGPASELSGLTLNAGTTYFIRVSGSGGGAGTYNLNINPTPGCFGTLEGTVPGAGPFPHVIMDTTAGADDTTTPSCSAGGADHVYDFTPAVTGRYRFETCGSSYDSLLEVRQDSCTGGAVIACSDDDCATQESFDANLTAGVTYYVIVDGFLAATGAYTLTISAVDICGATVEADLTGMALPISVMGNTSLLDDSFAQTCGPATASNDAIYRFSPASSGNFDVTTCGSTLDTILEVVEGDCVNGAVLGCNDNGTGCSPQSELTFLALTAGNTYYIRVSGRSGATGAYTLNISQSSGCPALDGTVPAAGPFPHVIMGDTVGGPDLTNPSCTGVNNAERYYAFTPAATDLYRISTCGSSYDTALHVRESDCLTGTTVACDDNNAACSGTHEDFNVTLNAGTTYFIIVDGDNRGPFTLTVDLANACTATVDFDITGMSGMTFMGDTTGADDSFIAGCGAAAAGPDHIYRFVPAVTQAYTLRTCGSGFDTILEIIQGNCLTGPVIACQDNGAGCDPHERTGATLTAGTTYYFRVSGAGGAFGTYVLDVAP